MSNMIMASVNWAQVGIVLGIFAAIAVILTVCILLVAKFCKTNADEKVENILRTSQARIAAAAAVPAVPDLRKNLPKAKRPFPTVM